MTGTAATIPVEERLFSLVLALLATDAGLTKTEILSTVQGYRQRYRAGVDNPNLERQFERDKDDIRELGVPLETVEAPGEPGNNQLMRYRIPRGAYQLPADISFSPEETTLLDLAARVWREGSLSGESQRALMKLRSLGVAPDEPVLGYAPRVRVREAAFEPLSVAIDRRVAVRFPYLKPGEERPRERDLAPLALVQFEGRWHLFAEDRAAEPGADGRHPEKMFLLRRIVGPVSTGGAVDIPVGDHSARGLATLREVAARNVAEIEVAPGSDAATRLGNRKGVEEVAPGRLRLHFVDLAILADELAGFGPEALVVSPSALRDAVLARLERTVRDHG